MMYRIVKGNFHKVSTIFGIEPRVLIKWISNFEENLSFDIKICK